MAGRKHPLLLVLGALCALVAATPAQARETSYVPGQMIVGDASGATRVVELPAGADVGRVAQRFERSAAVRYAAPNWVARAAATPLDRGTSGKPGGWRADQWNFLGAPGGIRVLPAWRRMADAGGPAAAAATTVAIVDSGIAYSEQGRYPAAPDFSPDQFVPGIDLVDNDGVPLDANGHGTHVAATIAEAVTLEEPAARPDFLTGIAPGTRLMPVRVLNAQGLGTAEDVAGGIMWAARNGADVINVSLQFDPAAGSCAQVPSVCEAVAEARRAGALVVGAAGNAPAGEPGKSRALFPGAAPGVLGVGATTEHGCLAGYSHYGKRTDLLAPGGGEARPRAARRRCRGDDRPVLQLSYSCFPACDGRLEDFAIRPDLGTSMAAAHTSGVAALVRSTRVIGRDPKPKRLARRLTCTARSLGSTRFYRAGMLDAARATARRRC